MLAVFNKTSIGFSHVKVNTPCQDFSSSYGDGERAIIATCDGHGGSCYVRSDKGSEFASQAVVDTFANLAVDAFDKYSANEVAEKIKLNVLCKWNKLVENSLTENPICESLLEGLDESGRIDIAENPVKAYGTTMIGAAVMAGKIVCVQIGDGGCFLIKQGEIIPAFDYDDEPVANLTYSMSEEDAYSHIKVCVLDISDYDGVICCTDGLMNPYENLNNFGECFVKPTLKKLGEGAVDDVDKFIEDLGLQFGSGDDVSVAIIIKSEAIGDSE